MNSTVVKFLLFPRTELSKQGANGVYVVNKYG